MMVIGLTGGIGSGKTTVANMFKEHGIPIYIADIEAKKLMNTSTVIREQIIDLLGEESYIDDTLNRAYIASKVFFNKDLLKGLNAIVHPAVHDHFESWKVKQKAPYVIKEAAVLFENEGYKLCDKTITVVAPIEERIARVQERDKASKKSIKARISNQWADDKKITLSDYVIHNISLDDTVDKVSEIHNELLSLVV